MPYGLSDRKLGGKRFVADIKAGAQMSSGPDGARANARGREGYSFYSVEPGETPSGTGPAGGRGRVLSHFGWGLGGFLLGAVFWSFLGFWQFIETVVLALPERELAMADSRALGTGDHMAVARPARSRSRMTTIAAPVPAAHPVPAPGCTELVRDLAGGPTVAQACRADLRTIEAPDDRHRPLVTAQRMDFFD